MKKYLLICNPKAASGRSYKLIPEIVRRISDYSGIGTATVEVFQSQFPGHTEEHLGKCDLKTYDAVIVVGGDGSLHEALNGLYQQNRNDRVPLGLIPAGTGNAFSRELGLAADDLDKAIEIICNGHLKKIDIASYSCCEQLRYYINIVSMGFAVDAGLSAKKLKWLGNSAYTLGTLWQTLFLKTSSYEITLDGETENVEAVLASISNSRYTGTSFLIAPEAKLDDGLLDFLLLEKISKLRILRLFPTIYTGKHIHYPEISIRKARKITIKTRQPLILSPDGEFNGTTPVEVECLQKDLTFLWPENPEE